MPMRSDLSTGIGQQTSDGGDEIMMVVVALLVCALAYLLFSRGGSGRGGGGRGGGGGRRASNSFFKIGDNFETLDAVTDALRRAGLESSNLIVGVDFTKSNEWTGKRTFGGRSLHHLFAAAEGRMNPYERAIDVIGRALAPFDDDDLIPVYGFGDGRTNDRKLFGFRAGDAPCRGFGEALARYRALAPRARLAGPTSFAPLIRKACAIVAAEEGAYHILLIVADGQVTRDSSTRDGQLSRQERATVDAIVEASHYPLSIVMVGVGDGPWDVMEDFDDNLPERRFDNFQFVRMDAVLGAGGAGAGGEGAEADFALHALMEVPEQYAAITRLNLADGCLARARAPVTVLPPPEGSGAEAVFPPPGGQQHVPVARPV